MSVVPAQFARVERYRQFHIHVLEYGDYEDLPQGSFVEAGTKWETAIISLRKRKNPFYASWDEPDTDDGFPNKRLKLTWMYISVSSTLTRASERLIRDIVEGRLVVYANGEAAPQTKESIRAFCQLVTEHLLYAYKLYILLTPADLDYMERHILCDYRLAREHYGEMKRAEWEHAQQQKRGELLERIEQTERRIASYGTLLAAQKALLVRQKSDLEQLEAQSSQVPEFLPAEEPAAPGEPAAAVERTASGTEEKPAVECPPVERREKLPRHTQLAFISFP